MVINNIMPDYSYITRSLLGLGPHTNLRYKNGLAVGINVETAAPTTLYYKTTDPSHVFLDGATGATDLYLPGYNNSQGSLVDGLYYTIKNIAEKTGAAGSNYTVTVKGKIDNTLSDVVVLREQEAVTLVYSEATSTWYITSHYSEW